MQKANVCHGKPKMNEMVRRRGLPASVVQDRSIEVESLVVRCQCRWKEKKSDEEAKKKQKEG
jgi:hypothetical protein